MANIVKKWELIFLEFNDANCCFFAKINTRSFEMKNDITNLPIVIKKNKQLILIVCHFNFCTQHVFCSNTKNLYYNKEPFRLMQMNLLETLYWMKKKTIGKQWSALTTFKIKNRVLCKKTLLFGYMTLSGLTCYKSCLSLFVTTI